MFPIIIFAGLAGLIAWAVKPKTTGISGPGIGQDVPDESVSQLMPVMTGGRMLMLPSLPSSPSSTIPPLRPEQERLLSLLVLFARDKKYPPGGKRYLTAPIALETVQLARRLSLPKTAMAVRSDGAIPDDEHIAGRSESVRALTLKYGTTGKA
jgi:hypothetical protein